MSGHEHFIIDINRSQQLTYLLFLLHGLSVVALAFLPVPLLLTVFGITLLVFSLIYCVNQAHEVERIIAKSDNEWLLQKTDGSAFSASLTGHTYISECLILLVFKSLEQPTSTCVCLMKDSVTASDFSLLKLKLKVFQTPEKCF